MGHATRYIDRLESTRAYERYVDPILQRPGRPVTDEEKAVAIANGIACDRGLDKERAEMGDFAVGISVAGFRLPDEAMRIAGRLLDDPEQQDLVKRYGGLSAGALVGIELLEQGAVNA